MYILAINGSPRKTWNTAQLLQSALKGAEDCGATTELIHLYDYDFTGCYSCLACKRKGKATDRPRTLSKVCIVGEAPLDFAKTVSEHIIQLPFADTEELALAIQTEAPSAVLWGSDAGRKSWRQRSAHYLAQAFAGSLQAELAATRKMVDSGVLPCKMQVGLTGKTVAPPVYIAVGVSGAVHHIAGMQRAGTVIAINPNPDAPIFQYADYGIGEEFSYHTVTP